MKGENDSPTHPISLHTDDGGGWDVLHLVPLIPLLIVGGEQLPLPVPCPLQSNLTLILSAQGNCSPM